MGWVPSVHAQESTATTVEVHITSPTAARPSQVDPSCSAAHFPKSKAQASSPLMPAMGQLKDKEAYTAL